MMDNIEVSELEHEVESIIGDSSNEGNAFSSCVGRIKDCEYIQDRYLLNFRIVKTLGTGSSSKVVLGINTNNNDKVAIKIIPRRVLENDSSTNENLCKADIRVFREAVISTLISHPYIVRLKEFYYNYDFFFLIFEYVKGRQLYDVIVNEGPLDEKHARRYFRQLLSALDFIHKNSIVHRDLKIENILIDEFDNIKLIDFGLSNFYDNKMLLNTFCGSLYFAAPELLLGNRYCGPEIDVWSLGIILYVLLNGSVPFDDNDVVNLQDKIKEAEFEFKSSISNEAKDLIKGMIQANPSDRCTLEQIIYSTWINHGYESQINSYMIKRYPIKKVNHQHLQILSSALSFQYKNLEREVKRYFKICREDNGSLEQIYWSRRPAISLYYLLIENFEDEFACDRTVCFNDDIDISEMPEIINRFVTYVISKDKRGASSNYLKNKVFQNTQSTESLVSNTTLNHQDYPKIRNTYLKGFFKGLKIKNIGSHNALKKILLDILNRNEITFKLTEKYYFCTKITEEYECAFRVSLYFNIILSEYYATITFINGDKRMFQKIHDEIYFALKNKKIKG